MNRFVVDGSRQQGALQMALMNIQDFLRSDHSLEPVSLYEEQLFLDWRFNAVPQDESVSIRRIDGHALVGE